MIKSLWILLDNGFGRQRDKIKTRIKAPDWLLICFCYNNNKIDISILNNKLIVFNYGFFSYLYSITIYL